MCLEHQQQPRCQPGGLPAALGGCLLPLGCRQSSPIPSSCSRGNAEPQLLVAMGSQKLTAGRTP